MSKKKEFVELGERGRAILAELETGNESPVERMFLVALARTFEIAAEADQDMKNQGMIQVFENGARQVSPEWAIFRNALLDARGLAKDLPKIRAAIADDEPEKEQPKSLAALMPKRKAM